MEILERDLISDLDHAIEKIKAEHAAKGLLKSGPTIKRVMSEIQNCIEEWYQTQLTQIQKLPIQYNEGIELQILDLVNSNATGISEKAYSRLNAITRLIGREDLYDKVIGDVRAECEQSKKRFENMLPAYVIQLKNQQKIMVGKRATEMQSNIPIPETTWDEIKKDYDINKKAFGKKITFVSNAFTRRIIFRDIEQAYVLAASVFSKPAVILAGSVIEELLRQYLKHKKINPAKDTFDGYIEACKNNGLLKSAIYSLTDSVRHFRNLVHLAKEKSSKHTISKATAKGAVSSIFTIANDFEK